MNYITHLARYNNLNKLFSDKIDSLACEKSQKHPLLYLISGMDETTKLIANKTNKACGIIERENHHWLKSKATGIANNQDLQEVSATLGEIRAYAELIKVWSGRVKALSTGADFLVTHNKRDVLIEVYTPQCPAKRYRLEIDNAETNPNIFRTHSIFPFGWPERRGIDNIQGEGVSRLAQAKQEEHQFDKEKINILWLDYQDPILWPSRFCKYDFLPISNGIECLTSGIVWNALYAKNGDIIYDNLSIEGLPSDKYVMEFDGKFYQSSIIDMVIVSTAESQVIFQNPNKINVIDDELYRSFYLLSAFNLEMSWLDWPLRGTLSDKVATKRKELLLYNRLFDRD